jgi:hypothetical protein
MNTNNPNIIDVSTGKETLGEDYEVYYNTEFSKDDEDTWLCEECNIKDRCGKQPEHRKACIESFAKNEEEAMNHNKQLEHYCCQCDNYELCNGDYEGLLMKDIEQPFCEPFCEDFVQTDEPASEYLDDDISDGCSW